MNFGSRIADERKAAGYSQAALAELCGVSREMWGKYERNAAVPGGDVLARTAEIGLDVLYILTGRHGTTGASASAVATPESPLGDRDRLRVAVEAVEEGLAETRRKLPPDKRAELFLAAYDLIAEMAEPEQSRANVIRLVRVAA